MRLLMLVLALTSFRCFAGDGIVAKSHLVSVEPNKYPIFSVLFDDHQAIVGVYAADHDVVKANFMLCNQTAGVYSDCVIGADRWFEFTKKNLDELSFNFGLNLDLASVLVQAKEAAQNSGSSLEDLLLKGSDPRAVILGIESAHPMDPVVKLEYRRLLSPVSLIVTTIQYSPSKLSLGAIESTLMYTIGEWFTDDAPAVITRD